MGRLVNSPSHENEVEQRNAIAQTERFKSQPGPKEKRENTSKWQCHFMCPTGNEWIIIFYDTNFRLIVYTTNMLWFYFITWWDIVASITSAAEKRICFTFCAICCLLIKKKKLCQVTVFFFCGGRGDSAIIKLRWRVRIITGDKVAETLQIRSVLPDSLNWRKMIQDMWVEQAFYQN